MDFTAGTWDEPPGAGCDGRDDADAEPNDADLIFSMNGDAGNDYGDTATADDGRLVDTVNVEFTETNTKGVNLSATGKEIREGSNHTYTVVLNSQPVGGNVNIEVSEPPSGVTVAPRQLEFTSTDWNTAQTVTITSTDNADTANHGAFTLDHTALGGGYTRQDIDDVAVQVMDDEAAGVVISTTGVTVDENGNFVYNIRLTQQPAQDTTGTDTRP